ncbi:putative peptide transport system permease protein BMEII0207/BMEII0208 [Opitutia bacterium]|nr:putative peptide transport system permease protein BMEII0207/BMEII0208 [Opitutae bacterium]
MSFFDPITLQRFDRFRRNRMGWWSLLTLLVISALALLGPLLVGNRPLVLKVDGVTHFPVFAGFISGRDLGLKIEGEPNYRLLAEELKQNGRGWLLMPPVPFAPGEVCEVMPEASRDAEGRWYDPRGIISEGRIFTLNTDGTRRQAWTIINGRPEGDARLFAEGVGIARAKFVDGKVVQRVPADDRTQWEPQGSLRTQVPSPCPPGLDGHWLGTDESGHDIVARLFGGFRILLLSALIFLPLRLWRRPAPGRCDGLLGGWFDMVCQRLMEVWSNIPSSTPSSSSPACSSPRWRFSSSSLSHSRGSGSPSSYAPPPIKSPPATTSPLPARWGPATLVSSGGTSCLTVRPSS